MDFEQSNSIRIVIDLIRCLEELVLLYQIKKILASVLKSSRKKIQMEFICSISKSINSIRFIGFRKTAFNVEIDAVCSPFLSKYFVLKVVGLSVSPKLILFSQHETFQNKTKLPTVRLVGVRNFDEEITVKYEYNQQNEYGIEQKRSINSILELSPRDS